MPDRTIQRHDGRDGSVYFFCAFLLVCLDIPGGVGADRHIVHHPAQHRVAAVGREYYPWVRDYGEGSEGYAGSFGKPFDRLQCRVVKK